MPDSNLEWKEYGRLILSKLESHGKSIHDLHVQSSKILARLDSLRLKTFSWGFTAGLAGAFVFSLIPNKTKLVEWMIRAWGA